MQSSNMDKAGSSLPLSEELKLCVIGMGYVGLPLALAFSRLYPVTGFDINQERIEELRAGTDHTLEASEEELQAARNLSYTLDADDMVACNVYIVTVPSPIDL